VCRCASRQRHVRDARVLTAVARHARSISEKEVLHIPCLIPHVDDTFRRRLAHARTAHLVNTVAGRIVGSVRPNVRAAGGIEHLGHRRRHVLVLFWGAKAGFSFQTEKFFLCLMAAASKKERGIMASQSKPKSHSQDWVWKMAIGGLTGALVSLLVFTDPDEGKQKPAETLSFHPVSFDCDQRIKKRFLDLKKFEQYSPREFKAAGVYADRVLELRNSPEPSLESLHLATEAASTCIGTLTTFIKDVHSKIGNKADADVFTKMQKTIKEIRTFLEEHIEKIKARVVFRKDEEQSDDGSFLDDWSNDWDY